MLMSGPADQNNAHKSAFSEFFEKNKSLAVLLPVLLVAVIVVIIIYANPDNQAKPTTSNTPSGTTQNTKPSDKDTGLSGQTVEILPQMERVTESSVSLDGMNKDLFATDSGNIVMTLKGLAISGEEKSAIIETANRAYVVSIGDKIGDWNIAQIDEAGVVLQDKEGNSTNLNFK